MPRHRLLVLLGAGASVDAGVLCGTALHDVLASKHPMYDQVAKELRPHFDCEGDIERFVRLLEYVADSRPPGAFANLAQTPPLAADASAAQMNGVQPSDVAAVGKAVRFGRLAPGRDVAAEAAKALHDIELTLVEHMTMCPPSHPSTKGRPLARSDYLEQLLRLQLSGTIATLNYDTTIEAAAEEHGIKLATVFDGGDKFPVVPSERDGAVRLLKIHGSVDWRLYKERVTPLKRHEGDFNPAMILGTGNKLRYYRPFLAMLNELDQALHRSIGLCTIGYGWRDEHVNYLIRRWAEQPPPVGFDHKHLWACTGDGNPTPDAVEALDDYPHMDVSPYPYNAPRAIEQLQLSSDAKRINPNL